MVEQILEMNKILSIQLNTIKLNKNGSRVMRAMGRKNWSRMFPP